MDNSVIEDHCTEDDITLWAIDKLDRVLDQASHAIRTLKDEEVILEDKQLYLEQHISDIIYNASKLLSFSCNGEYGLEEKKVFAERERRS